MPDSTSGSRSVETTGMYMCSYRERVTALFSMQATMADAVLAVLLYEESLVERFGELTSFIHYSLRHGRQCLGGMVYTLQGTPCSM